MATGFLCHELYMWHDVGSAALFLPAGGLVQPGIHAENHETKRRFRNLVERSGIHKRLTMMLPEAHDDEEDLRRFHTADYLAKVKETSAGNGGDVGEFAILPKGGYEIAKLSADGAVQMVEAVIRGDVKNGYALVRPPGHHAEADQGKGFCIFSNLVVAGMQAQQKHGVGRILTLDWDVHHGNGSQWGFYDSPDVVTISIHQEGLYPKDSGWLNETGSGKGEGCNINVPLPAGSGHEAYLTTMERVVLPAIERVKPDMIFVSSGFDSCLFDPLGRIMLHSESYRQMTQQLMQAADVHCGGRLVQFHEGGYSADYVPFCGLAVLEALSEEPEPREDPFMAIVGDYVAHTLYPHQEAIINQAAELAAKL